LELLIIALALGLISFIIPRNSIKLFGLFGSILSAGAAIFHLVNFDSASSVTLYENHTLPFGMTFHIGYDGLGLLMIALTNLIIPIILLSNYNNDKTSESPLFHALVFLMQFGLLGVFSAEDGILFYIFWEFTLIPIFLILYWFGSGTNKVLLKFFIYTLIGSLGMLLSFIALGLQAKSFDYVDLVAVQLPAKEACWIMSGIMLAFAIKIPVFPFHTWQPDTYTSAPMSGTMLLSALMLKMALFGMIKWMLPLAPEGITDLKWLILILSVVGLLYAAIMCIRMNDIKRLFAYASISHLGLIAAGIMIFTKDALVGASVQIVNHSLIAVGLFLIAEILESRLKSRDLSEMRGTATLAPKFGFWFAIIAFASVSVPFTAGFIGEFTLLKELTDFNTWIGVLSATTLVFGAVYTLRAYQLSMFGAPKNDTFEDLRWNEIVVFFILSIAVVVFGLFPHLISDLVGPSLDRLLAIFNAPTSL
jgi:NADH-quinone oxidoreductase subunit M